MGSHENVSGSRGRSSRWWLLQALWYVDCGVLLGTDELGLGVILNFIGFESQLCLPLNVDNTS